MFWILIVVLLCFCLWSARIVATCIATYFAKNRCLVFLNHFFFVSWCDALVLIVLSDEPRQNQGRGLVDRKLVKAQQ